MKISGITSPSAAAYLTNASKSAQRPIQNSNTLTLTQNRRFDTFTMVGTGEKDSPDSTKKLDEKTAELVRSLSEMSEDDNTDLAFDSYIEMQKALGCMKEPTEFQIECFKDLSDKKAYYSGLLDSGCFVGEGGGQYKFSDYAEGDHIDRSKVTMQLDNIQKCIDSFCGNYVEKESEPQELPPHVLGYITYEMLYSGAERMFQSAAKEFSAVTGISDSALNLEKGELYFDKEGVTEENFLERSNDLLNAINERSEQLKDIMTEYSYNQRHKGDKLKARLEAAEERQKDKDADMTEMIAKYEELLYKIDSEEGVKI